MAKCVLLLVCVLPNVASSAEKKKVPSDSELADVTAHGRFMAEYDVAAWHATDAMMALAKANQRMPQGH